MKNEKTAQEMIQEMEEMTNNIMGYVMDRSKKARGEINWN